MESVKWLLVCAIVACAGCTSQPLGADADSIVTAPMTIPEIEQVLKTTDDFESLRRTLDLYSASSGTATLLTSEVCSSRRFPGIEIKMQIDGSSGHKRVTSWEVKPAAPDKPATPATSPATQPPK